MSKELENMEQKRVQEVKGSYYIYLPKDWAVKYDLKSHKRVLLKRLDDDSLLIRASSIHENVNSQYIINLDLDEKPDENLTDELYEEYLFNQYLTAYITGIHTIIFKKRTVIPLQMRTKILKMTEQLHGIMVLTETDSSITVEDSTTIVDLRLLMRQIIAKVGISFLSYIEIIEHEKFKDLDELIKQDDQIDKHRYLIERQIHRIIKFPTLAITSKTNALECLHYAETAKYFERAADYIAMLAQLTYNHSITDKSIFINNLKRVYEIFITVQDYFEREDSLKYYELIMTIQKDVKNFTDIIDSIHPDKIFFTPLRRIVSICADISEIRINDILSRKIK